MHKWVQVRTEIREGLLNLFEFRDKIDSGNNVDKKDMDDRLSVMFSSMANEHLTDANREYLMRLEKNRANPFDPENEKVADPNDVSVVARKQIETLQDMRDEYGKLKTEIDSYDELKCASVFLTKEAIEYEEIQKALRNNTPISDSEYSEIIYRNSIFRNCSWLERFYYQHLRWFQKLTMVVIFSITSFVVLVALCAGLYETKSLI